MKINTKLNILYVVSSLINQAPVKVLYDIVSNIERRGNCFIITLYEEVEGKSLKQSFLDLGISVFCLQSSVIRNEFFTMTLSQKIQNFINDNNIKIVHTHCYYSALLCTNLKNVKKIVTFHNVCTKDFVYAKGYVLGSYMVHRYLNAIKKFDKKIAISYSMQTFYQQLLKTNVDVVYNGINVKVNSPVSPAEKKTIRNQLGLELDKKIFLVSGSLSKLKNPLFTISVFKKLLNIRNDIMLVFIGDGLLKKECIDMIGSQDKYIKCVGFVTEPYKYLQASDYLISSSFSEGLPLNVLEAICVGLPMALSSIPAHQEISTIVTQSYGLLFDNSNESSLFNVLEQLLMIDSSECNSVLSKIGTTHFSSEHMSEEYMKLYVSH